MRQLVRVFMLTIVIAMFGAVVTEYNTVVSSLDPVRLSQTHRYISIYCAIHRLHSLNLMHH